MSQKFEWDLDKNQHNIQKHGIDFRDAIQVFEGGCLSYLSPRNDEDRMVAVGTVRNRIIAVIYTLRANNISIISARMARRVERELFMQRTQYEKSKDL